MTRIVPRHASFAATAALLALGFAPHPLVRTLRDDQPNRNDTERIERGYYERILDTRRLDATPAVSAPFDAGRLCDVVDDLREYVLKPNIHTTHRGASWTTNVLGMRDRSYDVKKLANTYRIGIVGDSIGAGWGVDDGLGFEPLLEASLANVEILNFSVPGHSPGQRWEHFRRAAWPFSPDLVIFEATPADLGWDERRLRVLLPKGIGWDAPQYRESLAAADVKRGGNFEVYKAALKPFREAILANVYRAAVAECVAKNVVPAWVLIPRVGKPIDPSERDAMITMARQSGFAIVIDLSSSFDTISADALAIAPNDFHPNARGHAILAEGLRAALVSLPQGKRFAEGRR